MSNRQSQILAVALCALFQAGCQSAQPTHVATDVPAKVEKIVAVNEDSDADGLPDAVELHSFADRANFRKWFTALAEQQFYELSPQWNDTQRDCAGLVRFAMREALRTHDRQWFQGMNIEVVAPDVKAFSLERSLVGEKLFRTDYGAFAESDLRDGKLSEFADARTLKNYNAAFISRDRRQAQAGDLLFYHQPWVQKYPYHVMIFLGAARQASAGAADWVVYHTGTSANDKGEVRKARLVVLDQHPDRRWRPQESNKHFLGFYRLKMLE
ncbi:MAG: DUF1175 family protein [Acidobacteria bacterium]|nr:DUF1175 family protein [Acidobacteriota bacterium]